MKGGKNKNSNENAAGEPRLGAKKRRRQWEPLGLYTGQKKLFSENSKYIFYYHHRYCYLCRQAAPPRGMPNFIFLFFGGVWGRSLAMGVVVLGHGIFFTK